MGDSVSVDLFALTTFAHKLGTLADQTMSQAEGYGAGIAGLAQMIETETTMANGMNEAQAFAQYHLVVAGSVRAFLQEVLKGTSSLGAGAEVCAINYASTDQFNAEKLRQLQAEMKGGGTFAPIDFVLHGTGTVTTGDINSAFTPKDDRALWQTNTGGTTGAGTTQVNPLTPEQKKQLDEGFNKKVEENKQLLLNGQPVDDPKKMSKQAGQAITIGKDDYKIDVPKDESDMTDPTTAKPNKLVTG
jgi:hypothetical protein